MAEAQQWLLVLSCCSYLSLQIRGNLSEAYKAPCFAAVNAPKYCLQSYCDIWPTVFNSLISVSVESQLLRSAFKVAADLKIIYKNSTSRWKENRRNRIVTVDFKPPCEGQQISNGEHLSTHTETEQTHIPLKHNECLRSEPSLPFPSEKGMHSIVTLLTAFSLKRSSSSAT